VEVDVEFAPRPEYGLTIPLLVPHPGGRRTRGGPVVCVLSPASLDIEGGTARGRLRISAGTTAALALRVCSPWEELPAAWSESEVLRRLDATVAAWRS
jgi:alpha,alpha-trehalase